MKNKGKTPEAMPPEKVAGKKLVQSRLSFKTPPQRDVLQPTDGSSLPANASKVRLLKRKPSTPTDSDRSVKIVRRTDDADTQVVQLHSDECLEISDDEKIVIPSSEMESKRQSSGPESGTDSDDSAGRKCPALPPAVPLPPSSSSETDEDVTSANEVTELSQSEDNGSALPNTSTTESANDVPLTPKQQLKKADRERREQERLRVRKEKELKIQEEKEARQREKEERERSKREERETKERQRQLDKENREKKRVSEIEVKVKERQKREEARRKVEEEQRNREDEKRRKREEIENKQKRAAESFTKFFLPKPDQRVKGSSSAAAADDDCVVCEENVAQTQNFMPFCIKGDMKLAPIVRHRLTSQTRAALDKLVADLSVGEAPKNRLYLSALKSGEIVPGKSTKTFFPSDTEAVVILIDEMEHAAQNVEQTISKQWHRAKYLSFHENQRPAYYGTWQKRSTCLGPRKPFALEKKLLDYEIDSDDEWEEEEPGESLDGSGDEKDKESEDDYVVDNDFMVPHGHLSDEELQNQDDEPDDDNTPETQKVKLKLLQQEFAAQMGQKTERIKPRLFGCVWQNVDGEKPSSCPEAIWAMLNARAMLLSKPLVPIDIRERPRPVESIASRVDEPNSGHQRSTKITDMEVEDLIRLVHGNTNGKQFLVKEFKAFRLKNHIGEGPFRELSKLSILRKIHEIAAWRRGAPDESDNRLCWRVRNDVLETRGLTALPLANEWSYTLERKSRVPETSVEDTAASTTAAAAAVSSKMLSITKFTRTLTEEEKRSQFKTDPVPCSVPAKVCVPNESLPLDVPVKKRCELLMSVPRGEPIPQKSKNLLISNFLKTQAKEKAIKQLTSTNDVSQAIATTEVMEVSDDDDDKGDADADADDGANEVVCLD